MFDDTDFKIIRLLRENSRASYAELGREIALSASSVRERMQRMKDIGLIKGFGVSLRQDLLGNTMEVFILLKIYDGKLTIALNQIQQYDEVERGYRITGPQNILIKAALRDQEHLQHFIDKLIVFGNPTTLLILSETASKTGKI